MMTQYVKVSLWVILFGLFMLPFYVSAASITETTAEIGENCTASGDNSTAMGLETTASGDYSTAMGCKTTASGNASTAMGYETTASQLYSIAMGFLSSAQGYASTAIGFRARAIENHSIAMGYYTEATGVWASVLGRGDFHGNKLTNNIDSSFMVGYMADSEDATPELFVKDGGVGINTTDPLVSLHVKRNISGGAGIENHVAAIENTSTGSSPDVLMLKLNNNNPGSTCNLISFRDHDESLGAIEGNGGGGISLNTTGGDFAEYLPKAYPNEIMAPGDIVGLFPEGVSKKTQNAQRLMVVTSTPAVLGNRPIESEKSAYAPLAFLGQVPVRVKGAFSAGDFIIPSGRADGIGIAVSPENIKPSQYACVVGCALTSSIAKGLNKATVIVGLPQNELWNGIIKERDARIAKLENRLAALESEEDNSFDIGFLPGAGILIGSLGFLWVDRRRRGNQSNKSR